MALIQHVYRRGAMYWWRRRLPFVDDRQGNLRIEVSLRTRSPRAARRIAAAVTHASEQLFERNAERMLTPQEARRVLTQVARRHSAKADAVAASDLAAGKPAAEARQLDLATGWAMRILSLRGPAAAHDPVLDQEMRRAGLDEDAVELAWEFVDVYRTNPPVSTAKLKALLAESGILPTSVNLDQANQLYLRGMSIALLDVARRWDGQRPEDDGLMDRIHMEAARESPTAPPPAYREAPPPADHEAPPPAHRGARPAADRRARPAAPTQPASAPPASTTPDPGPRTNGDAPSPAPAPAPTPDQPHEDTEPPAAPAAEADRSAAQAESLSILALAEELAYQKLKLREWTDKTGRQVRSVAALFVRMLGHDDTARLKPGDVAQYRSLLLKLPKNYGKSPADKTRRLEEIISRAAKLPEDAVGVGPGTLNRHLTQLTALIDYIGARGGLKQPIGDVTKLRAKKDRRARDERRSYSDEDLKRLFALPVWTGCAGERQRLRAGSTVIQDARYWVPLIAVYSGLRREEACGLMIADVKVEDGVPYLDINPNKYRRLKNHQSKRRVPIHGELLRLGFLDYVARLEAEGYDLLFPELLAANANTALGDVFYKAYAKDQSAAVKDAQDKAFHSFRHWLNDEMKAADVSHEVRADILGHGGTGETGERYGSASRLQIMQNAIERVPVKTAHLRKSPAKLLEDVIRHQPRRSRRRNLS